MRKNIIITILLCVIAFLGCYMYATEHMSEDAINNIMEYLPFKEKKSIKRDSSKKHDIKKDKEEAERSDADNKNVPDSVKKKSHAKETITVESYKCKYCGDTIYYIIEDEEYGINGNICWACYWNKLMDIIFNDNNNEEESDVPDDDKTNKCSICGKYVGGKEMCECDGTIHHRTCHTDAYTCPGCGRYGLNNDPDIYGCPYCGYPDEDYDIPEEEEDEEPEEPEYTDEDDEEPVEEYDDEEYTEEPEEYSNEEEPVEENNSEEDGALE